MTKLRALGVELDTESLVGVEPRVRAAEPAFDPIYAATRDRAPIRFRYRKPDGEVADRNVRPWVLTSRGGHWYMVGFDVTRDAARAFRLSRIEGAVKTGRPGSYDIPTGIDVAALVGPRSATDTRTAVLRVRSGRGTALRLQAGMPESPPGQGWDRIELQVGDLWSLAERIASHGPDVVALEPPDLRESVLRLLSGAAAVHPGPPVDVSLDPVDLDPDEPVVTR
jgi:proteasome accessory factor B